MYSNTLIIIFPCTLLLTHTHTHTHTRTHTPLIPVAYMGIFQLILLQSGLIFEQMSNSWDSLPSTVPLPFICPLCLIISSLSSPKSLPNAHCLLCSSLPFIIFILHLIPHISCSLIPPVFFLLLITTKCPSLHTFSVFFTQSTTMEWKIYLLKCQQH